MVIQPNLEKNLKVKSKRKKTVQGRRKKPSREGKKKKKIKALLKMSHSDLVNYREKKVRLKGRVFLKPLLR